MADLDAIRRALAANLRTVLPEDEGHVSAYYTDAPKLPALQVAGVADLERIDFENGKRYEILVEGLLGRLVDRASQIRLDGWLEASAIDAALELPLTSRLQDDGTVLEDQEFAADSSNFLRFGGVARIERGQQELLAATWYVEVWT